AVPGAPITRTCSVATAASATSSTNASRSTRPRPALAIAPRSASDAADISLDILRNINYRLPRPQYISSTADPRRVENLGGPWRQNDYWNLEWDRPISKQCRRPAHHSQRSAKMGSPFAALEAGTYAAAVATTIILKQTTAAAEESQVSRFGSK